MAIEPPAPGGLHACGGADEHTHANPAMSRSRFVGLAGEHGPDNGGAVVLMSSRDMRGLSGAAEAGEPLGADPSRAGGLGARDQLATTPRSSRTLVTRPTLRALLGRELPPLRELDIVRIALAEPLSPNAPAPTPASDSASTSVTPLACSSAG